MWQTWPESPWVRGFFKKFRSLTLWQFARAGKREHQ
nr:MAG TPA: hypothetical protein [Caudoviricetes sp.]